MIGIDWGTSSLRAYRMDGARILERRESPNGIMAVAPDAFPAALHAAVGDWLAAGETRVLMAGMVGSRQGWSEAPYLPCPAGPAELAAALHELPFPGARLAIVPGLRTQAAVPDVMRGEETQLAAAARDGLFCLPGTHSKWAAIDGGRVAGFSTAMTGELFAALRRHTILARTVADAPPDDDDAFRRGAARAAEPGGLLHHLFGVRTLSLFGELTPQAAAAYLSGLLIGTEIAAVDPAGPVTLVGDPALCRLYALALSERGLAPDIAPPDAAAAGLALVAEHAGWN